MEYARSASTGTVVRKLLPCLLTFGILVPTLTAQSIWWDEGISLHLAGLPWIQLLQNRASNIHPPAYFLILKAWTGLVGRTPFTGRYLSALAAFLLPALVYRFLVARAGTRAARAGLVLVALAPPLVIYGQEARAYSLLLLWALALWGLVWPVARRRPSGLLGDPIGRGVLLGLVQAGFLGTHYAAVIGVGAAAVAYAVKAFRARDRELAKALWTEWLVGAGITALLVAPWLTLVIRAGVGGLGRQAGLANLTAEAAPAGYVARLIGIFHTVGLPQALSDPALTRPSLLVGALLLLGLALAFLKARCPRPVPGLLMLWLGPLLSVPVIWYLSPQSHPRYIYPYVFGGWLVAAAVIAATRVPRVVRLGLLGAILVTSLLGLQAYLIDPAYARSDVRGVAAYVRDHARAGDLVLVPHTDWSLEQYDVGAATVVMVPPEGGLLPPIAQDVSGEGGGAGARLVFAMDYRRGALDRRG
ncbi:MAG: glycosyltransferase family 39 protein, partial [Anaerolineae bacterium]